MELQKKILDQYMLLNEKPTLKKISADTGIQLTRVFRILNGSAMKLSEYQIFEKRLEEKLGNSGGIESMARECSLILNREAIGEIEIFLKRKIELWKLKQVSRSPKSRILTA